ncbi:SHOCT domain-containing protein [Halolamina sp. C58]
MTTNDRPDDADQAVTMLQERYARGELTDDEFDARLRTLRDEQRSP